MPEETSVPFVFAIATTAAGEDPPSLLDDPLVDGEGRTVVEVGEAWFNNTTLGARIVLDDLEAILFGRGEARRGDRDRRRSRRLRRPAAIGRRLTNCGADALAGHPVYRRAYAVAEPERHMESLLAALGLVFVAELGDKTQLVAMGLGARHRLAPVVAGIAIAYAATNLLSVLVGGMIGAALPTRAIGIGGGILFVAFAGLSLRKPAADEEDGPVEVGAGRVVVSVAAAMFVAELGDKTMLATATLAARGEPVLVWIGATLGIIASGLLGVLAGRLLGARIPDRAARLGSSALFAAFGVALIGTSWGGS